VLLTTHVCGAVTLELLRKRAEHNDKDIVTLEEISLHQENLDR
jgi:protein TilB